ncbi:hypothetical protein SGLAM104S_01874 [Streptomyces glaucescens]
MWPFLFRYAARPAAARMTTERFMRIGAAPSSPRRPAVPNWRVPPKRAVSSWTSWASMSPASSSRVSGSGSSVSQAWARARRSSVVTSGQPLGRVASSSWGLPRCLRRPARVGRGRGSACGGLRGAVEVLSRLRGAWAGAAPGVSVPGPAVPLPRLCAVPDA